MDFTAVTQQCDKVFDCQWAICKVDTFNLIQVHLFKYPSMPGVALAAVFDSKSKNLDVVIVDRDNPV